MSTALSKSEAKTLAECTETIARGMATFVEVGRALLTVRTGRLWRAGWVDFDSWCRDVHGFSQSYASRLITASKDAEDLPNGQKPQNERQARAAREKQRDQEASAAEPADEEPDDPAGTEASTDAPSVETEVGGGVRELNRVGWWLDELDASWSAYQGKYGDEADWMHYRIASEQFAELKGHSNA